MKIIGQITVFILLFILSGYILSLLWTWFIAPLGVPEISVVQAIGIYVLVTFLTNKKPVSLAELDNTLLEHLSHIVVAFIVGYCVHLFL